MSRTKSLNTRSSRDIDPGTGLPRGFATTQTSPAAAPVWFTTETAVRLAVLLEGVIVLGILGAAAGAKVAEVQGGTTPWTTVYFSEYGVYLLPIPLLWIFLTVRLDRSPNVRGAARLAFAGTSVFLLIALGLIGIHALLVPWFTPYDVLAP